MTFHMLYVHSTAIGYARLGVKLAQQLSVRGIEVDDKLDPEHPNPHHLAVWVSTPTHATGWFAGQHKAIFTMWESQNLPESFREGLHNFEQVIVPSDQNVELFSRYHPNVVKVPLGIDSKQWAFRPRTMPNRYFRFLIGGSGSRKGQDLAYKAFRKAFKTWPKHMPIPILQFKSPRAVDFGGERIEMIGGRISDQEELDLYGAAHCYLQPSRGEGFGLQPLQAIAQGLPTILTDAHGHKDFSLLGWPLSTTNVPADYFIFGDAGEWWEPSLDDLCDHMLWIYNNYEKATKQAEERSKIAHDRFSWERCADRFIEAVGSEHFNLSYSGSGEWVKPDYKRYLTMVTKPWKAEIAQSNYQFMPGKEYWEVADVKRLLWEADVLDPACVIRSEGGTPTPEESGLTPVQIAELGKYTASQSYCWTCGQLLNSGKKYEPAL